MDTREELDRLASALGKALGTSVTARARPFARDLVYVVATDLDRNVETAAYDNTDNAVAELRAILRADTDGAVADVLDELVTLAEEGLFSVEMLRTMARARRAK